VFESVGQESHQPAALGQHVDTGAAAHVETQLSAVLVDPAIIEIERCRNGAYVRTDQPVEMTRIAGAARIQRKVSLEIFEPGHERAVQRGTQLIEPREHALLRIALGRFQPGNEITAHFGHELLVAATADARRLQASGLVQLDAARPQPGEQLRVDEIVSYAETAFGELIDQARRRGRSPDLFAAVRLLLRAFSALRRFAAGLAAFFFTRFLTTASSMEPRHFGDPQRQA